MLGTDLVTFSTGFILYWRHGCHDQWPATLGKDRQRVVNSCGGGTGAYLNLDPFTVG